MAEAIDYKHIGSRPVRPDGVDKVTGRAEFGGDVSLPGMIIGKFFVALTRMRGSKASILLMLSLYLGFMQ